MQYRDDKQGSKFTFIVILFLVLYLALFGFDVGAAYRFAYEGTIEFFHGWF